MRTFQVSDEMYEQLKSFVVDPFDDTPEVVLSRLIEIVNKARDHWSPFEDSEPSPRAESPVKSRVTGHERMEDEQVVVL